MLFNTATYGVFLLVVLALHWPLKTRPRPRQVLLLAASYVFYGAWSVKYLALLAFSTLLDFGVGLALAKAHRPALRRGLLGASLVGNLGLLAAYKYYGFFAANLAALLSELGVQGALPVLEVALPVGISFYTFQTLSYTIDVYRRAIAPTRDLIEFALFVAFFPQLVAGPILRAGEFLPQLKRPPVVSERDVSDGVFRILTGLFKKIVIADYLGSRVVDPVFAAPGDFGAGDALLAVYAYALQIYGDFSGYSDIAVGSARLLGFTLPENFAAPYTALSVRDFWRRWHITLSTWLRDYLYIPLGGSRHGAWRATQAVMVTMLLGGLWHGAAWTFVAWGAWHGLALVVARAVPVRPPAWLARLATFHFVCAGWILFRSSNFTVAGELVAALARPHALTVFTLPVAAVLAVGFVSQGLPAGLIGAARDLFARAPALAQAALAVIALALFDTMSLTAHPFIYFQF